MTNQTVGIAFIAVGIGLVLLGIVVRLGGLGWFGQLPGDIRVERETFRIYFPITSMLMLSLVLSLILYLVRRLR